MQVYVKKSFLDKNIQDNSNEFNLDIVYEDKDLIVLNKPSGIVIHPGAGNFDNTIVNALMNYSKKSFSKWKKNLNIQYAA